MSDLFHPEPRLKRTRNDRKRPECWSAIRRSIRHRWLMPFFFVDWLADWAAYCLSVLSILELLEYCGSFSILIAVIFYFVDAPQRTKLRHYQAWQVINTAQGKGGSGGRIDALKELNEDHVPLVGVDLSDAFLQELQLQHADLRRSTFHGTDLKEADLSGADLEESALIYANLRRAALANVNATGVIFDNADLNGASLRGATLGGASFASADLRNADLADVGDWKSIASMQLANIHDVRNAPAGFVAWAIQNGAVDIAYDDAWNAQLNAHPSATTAPERSR